MADVTMYGADWCGDCRRAKAVFERHGIAYRYLDLVAEPEHTEEARRLGRSTRIPVIVLPDDTVLVEPSDADLEAALVQAQVISA